MALETAIEQFRDNIAHVKNLATLYIELENDTELDLSDLLRSEIVLAVSALDNFIHNITRIGILEILQGIRPDTPAYRRFQVSMDVVIFSRSNPTEEEWLQRFDNIIREKHSWQSFQHPDKIAEAIRLISEVNLWDEVARILAKDAKTLKQQLNIIIDRRNKIAHEADNIPHIPGARWEITSSLTDEAVEFIEQIAESIYQIIA